jgi:hypothetical protein
MWYVGMDKKEDEVLAENFSLDHVVVISTWPYLRRFPST